MFYYFEKNPISKDSPNHKKTITIPGSRFQANPAEKWVIKVMISVMYLALSGVLFSWRTLLLA